MVLPSSTRWNGNRAASRGGGDLFLFSLRVWCVVFAPVFVSDDGKGLCATFSVLGFFVAAAADLFYHDRACGELGHGLVWANMGNRAVVGKRCGRLTLMLECVRPCAHDWMELLY